MQRTHLKVVEPDHIRGRRLPRNVAKTLIPGCSAAMARIMEVAFPDDVDPALEAAAAKVLGHVWWSATISWANGMGDGDWVVAELRQASELIADRFS